MTKVTIERTRLEQVRVSLEESAMEPDQFVRYGPRETDATDDLHGSVAGSRPETRRLVESRRLKGKTDA